MRCTGSSHVRGGGVHRQAHAPGHGAGDESDVPVGRRECAAALFTSFMDRKGGGYYSRNKTLTTSFPGDFFFAHKRSHPITTSAVSPSTRCRCVARARAPINRRRRAGTANSATAEPPAITGSRPVTASRLRRRTSRPPRRSRTTARRITASAARAGPTPTRVGSGGAAVRITAARTARAASPTRRATSWTGSLRPPR